MIAAASFEHKVKRVLSEDALSLQIGALLYRRVLLILFRNGYRYPKRQPDLAGVPRIHQLTWE